MNPALRPVVLCLWLLVLVTFSAPGRDGPSDAGSLDVIALAKLAVRAGSVLVLGLVLLWAPRERRDRVVGIMLPWAVYIAWAVVSVLWSALPAVTLGQSCGLMALVLLGACCGAHWRGPDDTEALLRHLTLVLLAFCTIILVVDVLQPDLSGLDREATGFDDGESSGIVHPTAAGATASLGLILLLGARKLWGWRWTGWLMGPGTVVHVVLMIKANSRMALIMSAAALGALVVGFLPRRQIAAAAMAASLVGAVYLAADPGMRAVESGLNRASSFVSRGESAELMYKLTGRTDLWDAIWASFLESPLIGHGYFVTSKNGLLDVWSVPANRTAHNIFLQVMVTTGLVGLGVWLWAVGQTGAGVVRGLWDGAGNADERARVGGLLLVLAVWYVGWAQLAESFMGGVLPEAVLFFALLGLGLGPCVAEADGTDGTDRTDGTDEPCPSRPSRCLAGGPPS